MSGYIGVNLRDILLDEMMGEEFAKKLLSTFCISDKNKPPAMQVCSRIALALSKKLL